MITITTNQFNEHQHTTHNTEHDEHDAFCFAINLIDLDQKQFNKIEHYLKQDQAIVQAYIETNKQKNRKNVNIDTT
jgi:hypothetical protein